MINARKSEQAHIPDAPTLLENAVYNEWQKILAVRSFKTKRFICSQSMLGNIVQVL